MLTIPVAVIVPFPSKVSRMTPAKREAAAGAGFVKNPASFSAKVPFRVALEHPLFWAFAMGVTPRASTVIAAVSGFWCSVRERAVNSDKPEPSQRPLANGATLGSCAISPRQGDPVRDHTDVLQGDHL